MPLLRRTPLQALSAAQAAAAATPTTVSVVDESRIRELEGLLEAKHRWDPGVCGGGGGQSTLKNRGTGTCEEVVTSVGQPAVGREAAHASCPPPPPPPPALLLLRDLEEANRKLAEADKAATTAAQQVGAGSVRGSRRAGVALQCPCSAQGRGRPT